MKRGSNVNTERYALSLYNTPLAKEEDTHMWQSEKDQKSEHVESDEIEEEECTAVESSKGIDGEWEEHDRTE